jgi:hypothetical protein
MQKVNCECKQNQVNPDQVDPVVSCFLGSWRKKYYVTDLQSWQMQSLSGNNFFCFCVFRSFNFRQYEFSYSFSELVQCPQTLKESFPTLHTYVFGSTIIRRTKKYRTKKRQTKIYQKTKNVDISNKNMPKVDISKRKRT